MECFALKYSVLFPNSRALLCPWRRPGRLADSCPTLQAIRDAASGAIAPPVPDTSPNSRQTFWTTARALPYRAFRFHPETVRARLPAPETLHLPASHRISSPAALRPRPAVHRELRSCPAYAEIHNRYGYPQ